MTTQDQGFPPATHACARCGRQDDDAGWKRTEYRCPGCGFETAHLDIAPNGMVRGIFGYLRGVGTLIQDRYRVQQVLGKGGFGATYLVEDVKLKGKRRALKEVPELLFDEYEGDLLSHLNHPAIPDIIDRFVVDGMIYLVLEFGGTRTLGSECQARGGKVPLAVLLPWMRQLLDALIYLHAQKPPIIHRDLKPDNVLIDDHDRIMLIDFGIAKESSLETTTRMMARASTHGFSPPEQAMGTGTDERSDIYAFGATFYFLLTGTIPPPAHERVAGAEFPLPSALVAAIPAEIDPFLLSILSLNINQRPATVQEVRDSLERLERSAPADASSQSPRTLLLAADPAARAAFTTGGTPVQGIRLTTGELIPPKTAGQAIAPKRSSWARWLVVLGLGAALVGTGVYFYRIMHRETIPDTPVGSGAQPPSPIAATAEGPAALQTAAPPQAGGAAVPAAPAGMAGAGPGGAAAGVPETAGPVPTAGGSGPTGAGALPPAAAPTPTPATPPTLTAIPAVPTDAGSDRTAPPPVGTETMPAVPAAAAPAATASVSQPAGSAGSSPQSSALDALTTNRPSSPAGTEDTIVNSPPLVSPWPKPKAKPTAKVEKPAEGKSSGFTMEYKGTRKTD